MTKIASVFAFARKHMGIILICLFSVCAIVSASNKSGIGGMASYAMIGGVLSVFRKQIPVTYPGNNGTQIIQLNKSLAYREIVLNLTCQPTLTGVNNTIANTARGDEWGVVKRIRLIANSSDVIWDVTGDQLFMFDRYFFGNRPLLTTTLGDGATANPSINSSIVLPLWQSRAGKPMDTVYDSGGLTDFRLEITFGTFTDVNSAATAWTANPQIVVSSHENELTPAFYPKLVARRVAQTVTLAGSSTATRFQLDVGPFYRGFLINARTNATPSVDTVGLITNARLMSGSTVFIDLDEQAIGQYMQLRQGIPFSQEKSITTNIGFNTNVRMSNNTNERAWYSVDLVTDGYLSEAISTVNFNEFYWEFAVSAACIIDVISNQLLPNPRKLAA